MFWPVCISLVIVVHFRFGERFLSFVSLSLSLGHTETAARTQFTRLCSLSFIYQQTGLGTSGERERERERILLHCELYRKKSGRREIAALLATTRPGWCRWGSIFIYMGPPAPKEMEPKGGKSKALKKPGRPLKAEKKLASEGSSKSSKASRKAKRGIETYKIYIYKVLKQVHTLLNSTSTFVLIHQLTYVMIISFCFITLQGK